MTEAMTTVGTRLEVAGLASAIKELNSRAGKFKDGVRIVHPVQSNPDIFHPVHEMPGKMASVANPRSNGHLNRRIMQVILAYSDGFFEEH